MKAIADLHIHSRYSRATSRQGTPEYLDLWARKKGISILGTGDFTHPAWREELNEKLIPAEEGLYCLKEESVLEESRYYGGQKPRFVLSGEISSIYKKNGKVRKVHNVILLPSLEDAEKLSRKLETLGNIHSDGRPILGLDSHELLEIMLELCPQGILIPAHIWTPHFSMFGAFSGFDTVEECFEDLSPCIHAVETGLSSDPPMNWQLSALDRFQLISNSDAHSPGKLGREANLLDIELGYPGLYQAIQEGKGLEGTIEFFPEEGKYHYDGHRKCHLCLSPKEAEGFGGICPVCGRKLTIGVDHRVRQLADREYGAERQNKKPFEYQVPLPEVIATSLGKTAASKIVQQQYESMLQKLGPEFEILREIPLEEIQKQADTLVAEGIRRLRAGQVSRKPGYDGEYGKIRLFDPDEIVNLKGQISFLSREEMNPPCSLTDNSETACALDRKNTKEKKEKTSEGENTDTGSEGRTGQNNERQQQAAEAAEPVLAVAAGPGTGKTKTLVERILYLLTERKVSPGEITAVTFTNQAARELKERLKQRLGSGRGISRMQIGTFHSICLDFLRKQGCRLFPADPVMLKDIAGELVNKYELTITPMQLLNQISLAKTTGSAMENQELLKEYQNLLSREQLCDFDDLLLETLEYFKALHGDGRNRKASCEKNFSYLMVDEFQDISPLQYELIREWNRRGKELFVIGDPDQSIYGFRGADDHCFEKIKEDFPETRIISLEKNYRSTASILNGALSVIRNNPGMERRLIPWKREGEPIRVVETASDKAQAIFIAKEISRMAGGLDMLEAQEYFAKEGKSGRRDFGEIAVLYRTNRQARILEQCFQQEGIPYVVRGREDFLSEPLVRGTVSFFRSLEETDSLFYREEALKILWNSKENAMAEDLYEGMKQLCQEKWKRKKPGQILNSWREALDQTEDSSLKKLADMAVCYNTMKEFLDALSLGTEGDLKRCGSQHSRGAAVSLMTLHASKGLEFPVVFLYGVQKTVLPLEREEAPSDIREERRLFYVGMTRAREELLLTWAREPSVFLEELPSEGIRKEKAGKQKSPAVGKQLSLFELFTDLS